MSLLQYYPDTLPSKKYCLSNPLYFISSVILWDRMDTNPAACSNMLLRCISFLMVEKMNMSNDGTIHLNITKMNNLSEVLYILDYRMDILIVRWISFYAQRSVVYWIENIDTRKNIIIKNIMVEIRAAFWTSHKNDESKRKWCLYCKSTPEEHSPIF